MINCINNSHIDDIISKRTEGAIQPPRSIKAYYASPLLFFTTKLNYKTAIVININSYSKINSF